jgi:uncharacterized protein YacL (UPF0231 family)
MDDTSDATKNVIIHNERIFRLLPRFDMNQALGNAGAIKTSVFKTSVFGKASGIFRPVQAEEITITDNQLRYEPFWHVSCNVRYEYDRNCVHEVTDIAPEVHHLTINGQTYAPVDTKPRKFSISGKEHCLTVGSKEVIIDAEHGQLQNWKNYLDYQKETLNDDSEFLKNDSVFVQPKISSNDLIDQVLHMLPKPIKAEEIHEATANIDFLDLYFRPVYAFEYKWEPNNSKKGSQTAVVEFDGLTGAMTSGGVTLRQQVDNLMTRDLLFDVSAEAANLLIPGGGIAVRVTKYMVDSHIGTEKK